VSARITRNDFVNPFHFFKLGLGAPETTAGKSRNLKILVFFAHGKLLTTLLEKSKEAVYLMD
jgi:hypothetical protein